MERIVEIYKGYLDLITYLEEKFPGGVHSVHHAGKPAWPENLLRIRPTTPTFARKLIIPALKKFNELGTTQLRIAATDNETTIYTNDVMAALYVLHRGIERDILSAYGQSAETKYVDYLIGKLRGFCTASFDYHQFQKYNELLYTYDAYKNSGEEGAELWQVLHDTPEPKY